MSPQIKRYWTGETILQSLPGTIKGNRKQETLGVENEGNIRQ